MKEKRPIAQADTPEGQLVGDAIVEAVETQLRDNESTETRLTLERLIGLGETRENAIRYIATALIVEIQGAMNDGMPFNRDRYLSNLRQLPTLPYEDEDEI